MKSITLRHCRVRNPVNSKSWGKITPKSLITAEMVLVLNIRWIIDYLHLPLVISRITFILPLLLILWQMRKIVSYIRKKPLVLFFVAVGVFGNLMGWLGGGIEPILVIWTFINNSLYVFFFVGCIVSLNKEDITRIMEMLCKFNFLNVILALHQYFVLGAYSDYLGGLFGTMQGCNGYQNIYAVVVCGYLIYRYMEKGKLFRIGIHLAAFLIIAAVSDMVGFFVEICICLTIMLLSMPRLGRKVKIIAIILLTAFAGINVFRMIYPVRFEYFLNANNWLKYMGFGEESGGGIYGVSRTNPFSQINTRFFKDNYWRRLFGIGYGNASTSEGMRIFQSDFYLRNSNFQYQWFATSYVYVERGIVGLISYLALAFGFVCQGIKLFKEKTLKSIGALGLMYSICYVFIFFYNQTLINSSGYLMYLGIAFPFIATYKSSKFDRRERYDKRED